jgi:hypothetical protein
MKLRELILGLPETRSDFLLGVLPVIEATSRTLKGRWHWFDLEELQGAAWNWLLNWLATPDAVARVQAHPAPEAYMRRRLRGAMLDYRRREARYCDLAALGEDETHHRRPKHPGSDAVAYRRPRVEPQRWRRTWDDPPPIEVNEMLDTVARDSLDREILAALQTTRVISRIARRVQRRPATVAARIAAMKSRFFLPR